MISRRNVVAGLIVIPGALEAFAASGADEKTGYEAGEDSDWRSALAVQGADGDCGSTGDARDHVESRPESTRSTSARERRIDHHARRRVRNAIGRQVGEGGAGVRGFQCVEQPARVSKCGDEPGHLSRY